MEIDIKLDISNYSDTAIVITNTRMLTKRIGFNDTNQFLIATAASELATNIVRYAGKGKIVLKETFSDHKVGIEIVAMDSGPGIADITQAMKDHFSTGEGLGLGLSSVKRIMDEFILESCLGQGTTIIARKWK